jgi:hypothetical protein
MQDWSEDSAKSSYGFGRQVFDYCNFLLEVIAMPNILCRPYVSIAQILHAMMQVAAEHHRAGRNGSAKTMYLEVLALDSRHADALFLLGVLERQAGQLEEARRRLGEAARWTADRAPVEAELRIVEQLLHRDNRKGVRAWSGSASYATDCSALPMMARA